MKTTRSYILVPRAVVLAGHHLLLVRESTGIRPPSPSRWHLPGGEVLGGETPQRAAERLVKLRTGLVVEAAGCLDVLARRGTDPASGRQAQLLHVFFLCKPSAQAQPDLLPDAARHAVSFSDGAPDGVGGPPGGADWGWTDLNSGIAALRHDVVGDWVVDHLRRASGDPAAKPGGSPGLPV